MKFLNVIKEMSVNQDNEIALSEIEFTFVGAYVSKLQGFSSSACKATYMCGRTFQTTSLGHLPP